VLPTDLSQLLLLGGIICLVFASRMSWGPLYPHHSPAGLSLPEEQENQLNGFELNAIGSLAIIFSAMAGYYVCFWPGRRPAQRIFFLVTLPAVLGMCLILGRFTDWGRSSTSVLDKGLPRLSIGPGQLDLWLASPGFHVSFAGLVLIGIFLSRIMFELSALPIVLAGSGEIEPSGTELWMRARKLLWVLVGPLFAASGILGFAVIGFVIFTSKSAALFVGNPVYFWSLRIAEDILFFALVYCIVGEAGYQTLKPYIRWPKREYLLLGAAIPVAIGGLISSGHYMVDRLIWAATQFAQTVPPQPGRYFNLPSPWLLCMFFAALFEEVVFRGLLQTIFVRRYGFFRGIFLVGIVWSAYHFNFDASFANFSELGVLTKVGSRVAMCLSIGFVLSWLTIRSGSVWPSSITHTLYNVLVTGFGLVFPGRGAVWTGCWVILACFLFHYWPISDSISTETALPSAEPENAI